MLGDDIWWEGQTLCLLQCCEVSEPSHSEFQVIFLCYYFSVDFSSESMSDQQIEFQTSAGRYYTDID